MHTRLTLLRKMAAVAMLCSFGTAWAEDAKECLTSDQYKLYNHCNFTVDATWCVITNRAEFNCNRGFDNEDTIAPGGSTSLWPVRMPTDSVSYTHFAGCKGAYNLHTTFDSAKAFRYSCSPSQ